MERVETLSVEVLDDSPPCFPELLALLSARPRRWILAMLAAISSAPAVPLAANTLLARVMNRLLLRALTL